MGNNDIDKPEETDRRVNSSTKCDSKQQTVEKANERPEWLPDGWNVDFKTRKSGAHMGSVYKCYIDPLNGYKFYSKPEVLRYLETIKDNSCTPKKEKKCTSMHSPCNVVVEKFTVEDLPPGWIKEVKIRRNGNSIRKDPFYTDPVHGYVFRSKKDVMRYLESGDIGTCAFKPSRRQIQDEDMFTPSSAKRQKLKQSAPKRELFAGKEIFDNSNLELPDAKNPKKGQDEKEPSGMMVASVPTGESVVQMHSLEDGAANPPEMKKTSDPDDLQDKEHAVNMMESANEKNHSNPSISKKKEFHVHHRFSLRLAGIEPVQLANNATNEQILQVPKRNLRKRRNALDADMESKSSQHFNGVPEIEHARKMQQEVINTGNNLCEDQAVFKEQPHQLETDKVEDNKPEICTNSNKSSNKKEHHIPCQASKRLAGFEHELMSNSISCEKAPKCKSKMSKDVMIAELRQSEGGPATELLDYAPVNGESSNKRKNPQVEQPEDEEMDDEKSEPQLSFAFHYSWSDPSLEFAINNLTGVLPVEDSVDNGPIIVPQTDRTTTITSSTVPEVDIQKKLFDNVTGSKNRNLQACSSKSKNKKELKMPRRLSKRLAGLAPEVLPSKRAPEYATRKSCKEEPKAIATATLTNGASEHRDAGEETKLTLYTSDSLNEKGEKSYDAQSVSKEQLQRVEAKNISDEKSELQLLLPFGDCWSDPCLEFAIKTLTGALPVDASADILPVVTPDVNDPPNKELHESVVTSINEEAPNNSNLSQNKKKLNMVSQPSKLLLEQPELRTSSTSCENAPKFTTREYSDEGNITRNLDGEPLHLEGRNVTRLVHHSRNTDMPIHEEPLQENVKDLEGDSVTTEQQLLETETIKLDNSESQFCASFLNTWSDPCLEFAFKTLTGAIPVEDKLAIPGCFQEPANCLDQRDGGSMLPDFRSSSISQSDISCYYDIGVKTMPKQQSSMSSSFPASEKASLQGCNGVDPQKHYSQCNNNFPRR